MSRSIAGSVVVLVLLAVVASAGAKPLTAEFKERAGDAPAPALDLHQAVLMYDRATGNISGGVTLGAAPTLAVVNSVEASLGRFRADGSCMDTYEAVISMPDAADIQAGLPLPYTELFPAPSAKALGFLATANNGSTITFDAGEANPKVVAALKRGRFTCARIETKEPSEFKVRDSTGTVAFISGPRPKCRLVRRAVVGGRSFAVRCKHAGKRVTVRLIKGMDVFVGKEQVRRGRFRIPTNRSMRGRWTITIWKGDVVIQTFRRARVR